MAKEKDAKLFEDEAEKASEKIEEVVKEAKCCNNDANKGGCALDKDVVSSVGCDYCTCTFPYCECGKDCVAENCRCADTKQNINGRSRCSGKTCCEYGCKARACYGKDKNSCCGNKSHHHSGKIGLIFFLLVPIVLLPIVLSGVFSNLGKFNLKTVKMPKTVKTAKIEIKKMKKALKNLKK